MSNRKAIGQLIKEKRMNKGKTQLELSEETEISRSYISDLENGRYMPSVETLIKLAIHLEIDLNFLSKNDGNTLQK